MEASSKSVLAILNTTYLFSDSSKHDAKKFYDFLKIINNLVDQGQQGQTRFYSIEQILRYNKPIRNLPKDARDAIANVKELINRYEINRNLIVDYLLAKATDFEIKAYVNDEKLEKYMSNVADSVGLVLAKIFNINPEAYGLIKKQSRAFLYFSFIRTIYEDTENGRFYFPISEIKKYGLPYPTYEVAAKHPGAYREFIEAQLGRYTKLQDEARGLSKYLPYSKRVALKTTIDINNWEKNRILKNPFRIFEDEIKPNRFTVIRHLIFRIINA